MTIHPITAVLTSALLALVFFATSMSTGNLGIDNVGPASAEAATQKQIKRAKNVSSRYMKRECKSMNVEKYANVYLGRGRTDSVTVWKTRCKDYTKSVSAKCRELAGPFMDGWRKIRCNTTYAWQSLKVPAVAASQPPFKARCWSKRYRERLTIYSVHQDVEIVFGKYGVWSPRLLPVDKCHVIQAGRMATA